MILSMDASLAPFSWCLYGSQGLIAADTLLLKHYENLPNDLQHIFKAQGITPQDIERIAIVKGPGNYTGLRASLALVRTWHLLFGTPVVCKNRLETMLYHVCKTEADEVTIAQAVRMNEYFILQGKKTPQSFELTQALTKIQGEEWTQHVKTRKVFGDSPQGQTQDNVQWANLAPTLAEWAQYSAPETSLESISPLYTRAAVQAK